MKINDINFEQEKLEGLDYSESAFNIADMEAKCYSILSHSNKIKFKPSNDKRTRVIEHLIDSISKVQSQDGIQNGESTVEFQSVIQSVDQTDLVSCTEQQDNVIIYRPLFWLTEEDLDFYIEKYLED